MGRDHPRSVPSVPWETRMPPEGVRVLVSGFQTVRTKITEAMRSQNEPSSRPPAKVGEAERLRAQAEEHLELAFQSAGWAVSRSGSVSAPDLLCRRGNSAYALDIKVGAGRARRPLLQALLADAILQARSKAADHDAKPLAVLVAPSISRGMVELLERYVQEFAKGVAWGIVDARGRFQLFASELESISAPENSQLAAGIAEQRAVRNEPGMNPFTDLGQWMLKVLLAPCLPKHYWLRYRPDLNNPIGNAFDLARAANVSPTSASKFLRALAAQGYLLGNPFEALKVVRVESLFNEWKNASRGPWKELPVRFMLPTKDPLRRLNEVLEAREDYVPADPHAFLEDADRRLGPPGRRACLALFSAANSVDHCSVTGAPVHLYVETLSPSLLAELGLTPTDQQGGADIIVRQPRFPQSVFRGATLQPGAKDSHKIMAADLIQCWLDISQHPARGEQQASEIAWRLNFAEWSK